jgi:hypothetical protein
MLLYTRTRRRSRTSAGYAVDIESSSGSKWDSDSWSSEGIDSTGRRPVMVPFRGDVVLVGPYSRALIRHRQTKNFHPCGVKGPTKRVAVAKGASSGGSSGACLAFVTFLHKEGHLILAESDRSNVVQIDDAAGEGFVWSSIQNTGAERRVTHVRGYRSMDGSDYRVAWEMPYGLTTITENVSTGRLLQVGPGLDENVIPPLGLFYAVEFDGCVWYARNAEHPYRLWRSKPGEPQYVNPASYADTPGRETITAVARTPGDQMIVFAETGAFIVRKTLGGTFSLERLDSSVGCINHWGIVEIHRRLWFPSRDGYWVWDGGAFRFMGHDISPVWEADIKENRLAFGLGFAIDNRSQKALEFYTPRDPRVDYEGFSCGTITYVAKYEAAEPARGGSQTQPDWSIDIYGRKAASALYDANGNVQIGWCDGRLRSFSDENADDDGDPLGKPLLIRHGHQLLNQPGDDEQSGKTLTQLWTYVESELQAWRVYLLGGDESAWLQMAPDRVTRYWYQAVAASEKTAIRVVDAVTKTLKWLPKSVHFFTPARSTGRGYTLEIRADSPVGFAYRGHGAAITNGAAERPLQCETEFGIELQWRVSGETEWREFPLADVFPFTNTSTTVALDLRVLGNYSYGPEGPIDYTLTFPEGSGVTTPASVGGVTAITGTLTMPDLEAIRLSAIVVNDASKASGTITATGTDSAGVPATPATFDFSVARWKLKVERRIGAVGSPWIAANLIYRTLVSEMSVRWVVSGSNFPATLTVYGGQADDHEADVAVAAAGTYGEYVDLATKLGTYTVSATIVDADGRRYVQKVQVIVE